MEALDAIAEKHDDLVELMVQTANRDLGTSEAEIRQFAQGFVGVMQAAAGGDLEPRNEYLASVIPAIREAGMERDDVLDSMVRVAMAASCLLSREHLAWVTDFCTQYTRDLLRIWEAG